MSSVRTQIMEHGILMEVGAMIGTSIVLLIVADMMMRTSRQTLCAALVEVNFKFTLLAYRIIMFY